MGHDENDAPRQLRRQSNEVQLDNWFGEGADKYSARCNGKLSVQSEDWVGKRISPQSITPMEIFVFLWSFFLVLMLIAAWSSWDSPPAQ